MTNLFLFFVSAFASEGSLYKLDCPFFLRWSMDWQTCVVQWNTFYGLAITIGVIGIIVAIALVTAWKIYRAKTI